jgi:type IV secretion system protein VirB10
MKAHWILFSFFSALLLASPATCAQSPAAQQPSKPAPAAAKAPAARAAIKPAIIEVPSGTQIPLVLENAISTRSAHRGDPVYFQTLYPILVHGHIVIPAGSYMSGQVLSAKRPGRIKGRGQILLKLTQLILPNGYTASLVGTPSNVGTGGGEQMGKEGQVKGPTSRASDAGVIVRSTVYGAGIGAAAGGLTGARSGLGIGAAAGLLGVLLTRGPDAELPRGTTLDVTLDRPIPLLASRVQFKTPGRAPQLAGPPNREPRRPVIPF